ncbi:MAG: zinc ribbon domain-containing protein [Rhodocyclales bacterium]|nr:zinc ribbon domain-containing protein [Rhodocyclales bacterium]
MPLYEYAPSSGHCDQCAGKFEVVQRMADDKLSQCPRCGQACERQISRVALGGKYSTSESAIKNSGFTRYQKAENGVYERTAGSGGPEVLYRD